MRNLFARFMLISMLAMSSTPAMAGMFDFLDLPGKMAGMVVILLTSIITFGVIIYMIGMILVQYMIADVTIALAAIFMPFAIAFYPISNSWATSALNVVVGAVMTKVGIAFFLGLLLGSNGMLNTAVKSATENGDGLMNTLGACIGVLGILFISITMLNSIPGIITSIFGGFSFSMPRGFGKAMSGMATGGAMAGGAVAGAASVAKGAYKAGAAGSRDGSGMTTGGGKVAGVKAALSAMKGGAMSGAKAGYKAANPGQALKQAMMGGKSGGGGNGGGKASAPSAPSAPSQGKSTGQGAGANAGLGTGRAPARSNSGLFAGSR